MRILFNRLKNRIRNSQHQPELQRVMRYTIAGLIAVVMVNIARLSLPLPAVRAWPSLLFVVVLLSSWYGGLGPGMLSAVVVVAGSELVSHSPLNVARPDDLILLVLLLMVVVVLSSIQMQQRHGKRVKFSGGQAQAGMGMPLNETASVKILESFQDIAIVALDPDQRFTYINEAASDLLQRVPGQLVRKTLFDVFPERDAAILSRHLGRVYESGAPGNFEQFVESRQVWFTFHCYPNENGLVFNFSDITKRKKQEALRPLPVWTDDREFMRIFGKIEYTLVDHARCYVLHQLAKQAAQLPGDLAEVGVYRGGTAKLLALTVAPRAKKDLQLFDTFTGMPPADANADRHHEGDLGDTSLEAVQRSLRDCKNVYFYKGFFPDTASPIENSRFCMVHIDADIYKSVKDSCVFFYPRMEKGGIMVFDDYGFPSCPGARKAVNEFFSDKPEAPIYLPSGQCVVFRK
jgi:O-methyltransferase